MINPKQSENKNKKVEEKIKKFQKQISKPIINRSK